MPNVPEIIPFPKPMMDDLNGYNCTSSAAEGSKFNLVFNHIINPDKTNAVTVKYINISGSMILVMRVPT